jgi:hypothetical protein
VTLLFLFCVFLLLGIYKLGGFFVLTNTFLSKVYFALDYSDFFEIDDFSVTLPEEKSYSQELIIKYLFDETCYFHTYINGSSEFRYECSPGKVMKIQKGNVSGVDIYTTEIRDWVKRMEDEFKTTPLARRVMKNQSQVEELIDKVDSYFVENGLDSNDKFSHPEMEEMESKLEDFKALIEERLAEQITEKDFLKQESLKLFKEIDFLKKQVQILTKKNWFKAFCSKTGKFIRNNPETTKAIAHTAKECLPESIKMSIPEGATEVMNTLLEEQKVEN